MFSFFNKKNNDINFMDTLNESDRAEELKAKRSSNQIFVLAGLSLIVILGVIFWVSSQNSDITKKLKDTEDYMANQQNIDAYKVNDEYNQKTKKIQAYNVASDKFINQLKDSKRFSSKWIEFFNLHMQQSLTSGTTSKILSLQFSKNGLILNCATSNNDYPRVYASTLTKLTKEDGTPMFKEVGYKGFNQESNLYGFQIQLLLW